MYKDTHTHPNRTNKHRKKTSRTALLQFRLWQKKNQLNSPKNEQARRHTHTKEANKNSNKKNKNGDSLFEVLVAIKKREETTAKEKTQRKMSAAFVVTETPTHTNEAGEHYQQTTNQPTNKRTLLCKVNRFLTRNSRYQKPKPTKKKRQSRKMLLKETAIDKLSFLFAKTECWRVFLPSSARRRGELFCVKMREKSEKRSQLLLFFFFWFQMSRKRQKTISQRIIYVLTWTSNLTLVL